MSRRISQLPEYPNTFDGTEEFPFEHNGNNWKVTAQDLAAYVETTCIATVQKRTITLTSAQILTLNSVPVEVVPAPGTGKATRVISVLVKLVNTGAITVYNTNTSLAIASNTLIAVVTQASASSFLAETSSSIIGSMSITGNNANVKENEALKLYVTNGDPLGGNSGLKVYVTYETITI